MHILSGRAFTAFTHRKLYPLTFIQGTETIAHDSGIVHKNVTTGITVNKTIPFILIKPFDCACFLILHFYFLTLKRYSLEQSLKPS